MDPVVLVAVSNGVTALAKEVVKGAASDAGKAAWVKVKSLLGWTTAPAETQIALTVAEGIAAKPEILGQLQEVLERLGNARSESVGIEGDVHDNKNVVVAGRDINTPTFR